MAAKPHALQNELWELFKDRESFKPLEDAMEEGGSYEYSTEDYKITQDLPPGITIEHSQGKLYVQGDIAKDTVIDMTDGDLCIFGNIAEKCKVHIINGNLYVHGNIGKKAAITLRHGNLFVRGQVACDVVLCVDDDPPDTIYFKQGTSSFSAHYAMRRKDTHLVECYGMSIEGDDVIWKPGQDFVSIGPDRKFVIPLIKTRPLVRGRVMIMGGIQDSTEIRAETDVLINDKYMLTEDPDPNEEKPISPLLIVNLLHRVEYYPNIFLFKKILDEYSIDKYFDEKTMLMLAAQYGNKPYLDLLIAADADVNLKTKSNETAFSLASVNGHSECAESLLRAGAENLAPLNSPVNPPLLSFMFEVALQCRQGAKASIKKLKTK